MRPIVEMGERIDSREKPQVALNLSKQEPVVITLHEVHDPAKTL